MLPKVFADVPSAEELAAAKKKVDEAKAAAGRMGLIAGLLAVALVGVTGFLGYTMSKPPEGQSVVADLQDKQKKSELAIAESKKALEANNGDVQKAADWLREKGIAGIVIREMDADPLPGFEASTAALPANPPVEPP